MVDMLLNDVLQAAGIGSRDSCAGMRMSGLALDSRRIRPGNVFIALAGCVTHGMTFAADAQAKGAVAILAEGTGSADLPGTMAPALRIPVIWVNDLRRQLGDLCNIVFDHPSRAMRLIGITGTNGKTSCVHFLTQALHAMGHCAGSIGTLGWGLYGQLKDSARTTPDIVQLYTWLDALRRQGATHVVMEVSSHALDQQRVAGLAFDVAGFTNLTRDHLDYHRSMQAYGAAKARLFAWPGLQAAVINIDDAFGDQLRQHLAATVVLHTISIDKAEGSLRADRIAAQADGVAFTLHHAGSQWPLAVNVLGQFNVSNLLLVSACLLSLGIPLAQIVPVLETLQPVPGRMQQIDTGAHGQPLIVIDYAHTPDALDKALMTVREHCRHTLICVFGCGGERDRGKRAQMAKVAAQRADRIIVTDDNPRGEDGDAIIADILHGFEQPDAIRVVRDRRAAIAQAVHGANGDDAVLIAGKGHEAWQEINGKKIPFSDYQVAQAVLQEVV